MQQFKLTLVKNDVRIKTKVKKYYLDHISRKVSKNQVFPLSNFNTEKNQEIFIFLY